MTHTFDKTVQRIIRDEQKATTQQHYFLVTGELVFRRTEDEVPNAIRMNAVVTSKDGRLGVAQIGKAQQALQLQFHKRMEDPTIQILDVVIMSLVPLGVFIPEEFHAAPAGTELREMNQGAGHA
jgi:hypothetical protein